MTNIRNWLQHMREGHAPKITQLGSASPRKTVDRISEDMPLALQEGYNSLRIQMQEAAHDFNNGSLSEPAFGAAKIRLQPQFERVFESWHDMQPNHPIFATKTIPDLARDFIDVIEMSQMNLDQGFKARMNGEIQHPFGRF